MVTSNAGLIREQVAALFGQMRASWEFVKHRGDVSEAEFFGSHSPFMVKITELYEQEFSLARLLDRSDLVIHADGPGVADHDRPNLHTVNWLCSSVEQNLRALAASVLPLAEGTKRLRIGDLDLRLAGMAPGSLYVGFAVEAKQHGPGVVDAAAAVSVRSALGSLPEVPQFIGTETISSEILEAMPDPAMRDASLMAAYKLAPSGRLGIRTLGMSVPGSSRSAELNRQDREVLKEMAVRRPVMKQFDVGTFAGDLRMMDLDGNRAVLRNVDGIGSIRLAFEIPMKTALKYFGSTVKVAGPYDVTRAGAPRLMRVQSIESVAVTSTAGS